MAVIHDKTPIWFGIHNGKAMEDVPDDYLIYLYKEGKLSNDLRFYVEDSFDEKKLKQ